MSGRSTRIIPGLTQNQTNRNISVRQKTGMRNAEDVLADRYRRRGAVLDNGLNVAGLSGARHTARPTSARRRLAASGDRGEARGSGCRDDNPNNPALFSVNA